MSVAWFLLAMWKKGTAARFYRLRRASAAEPWAEITRPRFDFSMTNHEAYLDFK